VTDALAAFSSLGAKVVKRSSWYSSEPVPPSNQAWFVNGVVLVTTALEPAALLARLLRLEDEFERVRCEPNDARTLDLDLLDYDSRQCDTATLILPHPRLHLRRFVLEPLREIAPEWRHPRFGLNPAQLLRRLPPGQSVIRLDGECDPDRAACATRRRQL
jgi:2-amino-4-hydroxy-6-hydroxymethyldihydropteridine diphosphokinase